MTLRRRQMANLIGNTTEPDIAGVFGENTNETDKAGPGVHGVSKAVGVWGESATWHGVAGFSQSTTGGFGVFGANTTGGTGVVGESKGWMGVYGKSESTTGGAGVMGEGDPAPGLIGKSTKSHGVYGETSETSSTPVAAGVWGEHKGNGSGVVGISNSGAGVYGKGGRVAGFFEGDVEVTRDIRVKGDITLENSDCAEDFDIANGDIVDPGTVMVLGDDGALQPSQSAYDKRVAGVVSGAGNYKPGIVLDKRSSQPNRKPVALLGKVYCKVDATFAPVEIGDLLTTSPTSGHAMKTTDQSKAFGAVIGKALRPLSGGQGLIPILVALQ
jgi:hypothetical protein